MSQPLLSISHLSAAYGPVQALRDVTLEVMPGEIVSIIGSNGAGKTTLLMSLFGQPAATHGNIVFNGLDITHRATHQVARLGIALVPEGRRIFPRMTVEENLMMGATAREDEVNFEAEYKQIFELFPILLERRYQRAGTLSGGQQQMLAIGRGLMARPKLLLLDEPSLGLAPKIVQQIFATLRQICGMGVTILLVEQNANHALRLSQRGYVLVNGQIQLSGTGQELLTNPEVREAYLGA